MTTPKEALELKPCPFCGGPAHIQDADDERLFFVTCDSIECFCAVGEGYDRDAMPDHSFFSREEAAKAWNTRAASLQGEDAVERVARIIDPYAWTDLDDMTPTERFIRESRLPWMREDALTKARAILATGLVPDEAAVRADASYLDFFEKNTDMELSCSWEDDDGPWEVHSITGGRNDREWTKVGQGATPREAIAAAIRSGGGE